MLNANRKKREEEEKARQAALRAQFEKQKAQNLKEQDFVLNTIKRQKSMERRKEQQEKDAIYSEAMGRLNQLQFTLSFSDSTA